MSHYMNKQYESHMTGKKEEPTHEAPAHGEPQGEEQHSSGGAPSIHIHSHGKGTTVHIMHADGRHEAHEHGKGDAEGVASHVHTHIGGAGQDHGGSSGGEMEDEYGLGGPGV